MKRTLALTLSLLLFTCIRSFAQDETGEQVVNRYIKLIADKGYVDTIRTTRMEAMGVLNNDTLNVTILKEAGRSYYIKVQGPNGEQVRIYNKGAAVLITGGNKEKITDRAELDELKLVTNILPDMFYKKNGYKMILEGMSKQDGVEYNIVRLESPNGYVKTNYYERESGLLRIVVDPDGIKTQLTEYVKFKGGLYNKRNIITFPDGLVMELVIKEIVHNEKIDPAVFQF